MGIQETAKTTNGEDIESLPPLQNQPIETNLGFIAFRSGTASYHDDPAVRALFRNFPPMRSIAEQDKPDDN